MAEDQHTAVVSKRAPTLYVIIAMKLLKGTLFVALAVMIYTLSDNDLTYEYRRALHWIRFNPERRFWVNLASKVDTVTETQMLRVALGTFIYSMFSLVEGIGLMFRIRWIGWLAICESGFFIPIEVVEMINRFNWLVPVILGLNVLVFWYLLQNRERLFSHH